MITICVPLDTILKTEFYLNHYSLIRFHILASLSLTLSLAEKSQRFIGQEGNLPRRTAKSFIQTEEAGTQNGDENADDNYVCSRRLSHQ